MQTTVAIACPKDDSGNGLFGWCMDGHHEKCPGAHVNWNHELDKCGCKKHEESA